MWLVVRYKEIGCPLLQFQLTISKSPSFLTLGLIVGRSDKKNQTNRLNFFDNCHVGKTREVLFGYLAFWRYLIIKRFQCNIQISSTLLYIYIYICLPNCECFSSYATIWLLASVDSLLNFFFHLRIMTFSATLH